MAQNNSFDPPIDGPRNNVDPRICQVDNRAVNQPFGAIPSIMNKIGTPDFPTIPIGVETSRRGGRRRSK